MIEDEHGRVEGCGQALFGPAADGPGLGKSSSPSAGNGVCDFSESFVYEPQDCAPGADDEAVCTGGVDDDQDGLIDCSDPDCALSVANRCGQVCGSSCDVGGPGACNAGCNSCSNHVRDCGETGLDCGGSCAACVPVTLFSDDFSTDNTSTLASKWTELPTGTTNKWEVTGTAFGSAGYPNSTTGAKTAHAAACSTGGGCYIKMTSGVNLAGKGAATLAFWRFVHSSLDAAM